VLNGCWFLCIKIVENRKDIFIVTIWIWELYALQFRI